MLDQYLVVAAMTWKDKDLDRKWQEKKPSVDKNKEILNAKILGIFELLKRAKQNAIRANKHFVIGILCNSQTAMNKLAQIDNSEGQVLKIQVYQNTDQFTHQENRVLVYWIPYHDDLKENKNADKAAKKTPIKNEI